MQKKSFIKNILAGIYERLRRPINPYKEVNLNWLTLKYYKHLPPGKLRRHRMLGKNLYFNNASELLHGLKEIFIDKTYQQQLSQNPYIIDCGANIGLSVIYIKENHPTAQIVAFEPDEKNFMLLSKNIDSFGYKNVTIRKEAVWTENTLLQFSNEGSMSSKIDTSGTASTTTVKAIRLKEIIDREVDFLKIDIEGAEYEVLKDCGNKLSMVKNLFIEYHGYFKKINELNEIFSLLLANNFSFYIKEATDLYPTPFSREKKTIGGYEIQLNIFCFKN